MWCNSTDYWAKSHLSRKIGNPLLLCLNINIRFICNMELILPTHLIGAWMDCHKNVCKALWTFRTLHKDKSAITLTIWHVEIFASVPLWIWVRWGGQGIWRPFQTRTCKGKSLNFADHQPQYIHWKGGGTWSLVGGGGAGGGAKRWLPNNKLRMTSLQSQSCH